jgi:cell division inhibitor SulA
MGQLVAAAMRPLPPISATTCRQDALHSIAASLPHPVWRADALGSSTAVAVPTGYADLDAELPGGGWPTAGLADLLFAQQGAGEFRLLAPVLQSLTQSGQKIIVLAPPHILSAPALEQMGVNLRQVLILEPTRPADSLWAAEQVLRSGCTGAMLAWLPQAQPDHLRRLQVAAAGCEGLAFIYRPASFQSQPSPAPLRLRCEAGPYGDLIVDIVKRRGPAAAASIVLPPVFPPLLVRALNKARAGVSQPAEATDAVDRRSIPATAARRRPTSLA